MTSEVGDAPSVGMTSSQRRHSDRSGRKTCRGLSLGPTLPVEAFGQGRDDGGGFDPDGNIY